MHTFSRLGQSIFAPQKLSGGQFQAQCNILTVIKESRKHLLAAFVFALPIFTVRATIVAPQKLSGGQFQAQCNILTVVKESRKLLLAAFVFALPIFTVRATILCRQETCRWHVLGKEKTSYKSRRSMCLRYLFSRPVTRQLSSAYMCLTSVFGMGTGGPT